MTVAADLLRAQGCLRRYFLKIGGLPYVLNQRVAGPDGDDTPLGEYGAVQVGFAGKLAPVDADCIAGYRFDEASQSDGAVDVGTNGLDLTLIDGGSGYYAPPVDGCFNGARRMTFNDAHTYGSGFYHAYNALFCPASVTAMAWVRFQTLPGVKAQIAAQFNSRAMNFSAWSLALSKWGGEYFVSSAFNLVGISGNWGCPAVSAANIPVPVVGEWHHAAATYDAATGIACVYWDGLLASTRTAAGAPAIDYYAEDRFITGWREGNPQPVMDIDDLFIYDVAKSAEWIADIYGGGIGGLNCLRAPSSEATTSLDLGTLKSEASSMTFELDDIEDPADG